MRPVAALLPRGPVSCGNFDGIQGFFSRAVPYPSQTEGEKRKWTWNVKSYFVAGLLFFCGASALCQVVRYPICLVRGC